MADIALSAAIRSNLLALQTTQSLVDRTQGRLSTGLSVNSATDDAVKFFQAKSLSDRATDLLERKSAIDQGVQALETALRAAESIENLTKQIKGIVDASRSSSASQRAEYTSQITELATQIEKLVNDASYQGLNLLNASTAQLNVRFSEKSDSKLTVNGVNFQVSGYFFNSANAIASAATFADVITSIGFTQDLSVYNLSDGDDLATFNLAADAALESLDFTIANLRAKSANIANNVAILQVRSEFTQEYTDVLETGAGLLTLADLNEEGANLLALQTRQSLGIQALSFAGQAEQSVLGLFR
ncbi:MAG: flagellin [Magnetospiraceae bacterium]